MAGLLTAPYRDFLDRILPVLGRFTETGESAEYREALVQADPDLVASLDTLWTMRDRLRAVTGEAKQAQVRTTLVDTLKKLKPVIDAVDNAGAESAPLADQLQGINARLVALATDLQAGDAIYSEAGARAEWTASFEEQRALAAVLLDESTPAVRDDLPFLEAAREAVNQLDQAVRTLAVENDVVLERLPPIHVPPVVPPSGGPPPAIPTQPEPITPPEVAALTHELLFKGPRSQEQALDLLIKDATLPVGTLGAGTQSELENQQASIVAAARAFLETKTSPQEVQEAVMAWRDAQGGVYLTATDRTKRLAAVLRAAVSAQPKQYKIEARAQAVPEPVQAGERQDVDEGGNADVTVFIQALEAAGVPAGFPVHVKKLRTGLKIGRVDCSSADAKYVQSLLDNPDRYGAKSNWQANTDEAQRQRMQGQRADNVEAPVVLWTVAPSTYDLRDTVRGGGSEELDGKAWSRVVVPAAQAEKQGARYGVGRYFSEEGFQAALHEERTRGTLTPEPVEVSTPVGTIEDGCVVLLEKRALSNITLLPSGEMVVDRGQGPITVTPSDTSIPGAESEIYVLADTRDTTGDTPPKRILDYLNRGLDSGDFTLVGGTLATLLAQKCATDVIPSLSDIEAIVQHSLLAWQLVLKDGLRVDSGWTDGPTVERVDEDTLKVEMKWEGTHQKAPGELRMVVFIFRPDAADAPALVTVQLSGSTGAAGDYQEVSFADNMRPHPVANLAKPPILAEKVVSQFLKSRPQWTMSDEQIRLLEEEAAREIEEIERQRIQKRLYEGVLDAALARIKADNYGEYGEKVL